MKETWHLQARAPSDFFQEFSQYSPFLLQLLWNRNIRSATDMAHFLTPDYERDLHDPFRLRGMDRAVSRIQRALERGEYIMIFSDYDADGVCGAAVLSEYLSTVGARFEVRMPNRLTEHYGLTKAKVREFADSGVSVLVTIDCGVSDFEEIQDAQNRGIDVLVIDHHLVPPRWPPAYAVVDHKHPDETYPEHVLSGAGLAYKLVQGLAKNSARSTNHLKWSLDLAAIAAVADMVPLTGENRAVVVFGLKVIQRARRQGLAALLEQSRISVLDADEETIGFAIAPRINAASRMDTARLAFDLLLADNPAEAGWLASNLETKNTERKRSVEQMMQELEERLAATPFPSVIFEGASHWGAGILGLAASRLVEQYQRPAFIYCSQDNFVKGSCRAPVGMNIVDFMRSAENYFSDFGGHTSAGGFSFEKKHEGLLKKELESRAASLELAPARVDIDGEILLRDVNNEKFDELRRLAPFGIENSAPLFVIRDVLLRQVRRVGAGKDHTKLTLGEEGVGAIFFRSGDRDLPEGGRADIVCVMQRNTWHGNTKIELRIIDLDIIN